MLCLIFLKEEEKEEGENSDTEEEVPEATERKEHYSCGQTGVENVQSTQAMELAGAAPEKEQGKEVRGPCYLSQLPLRRVSLSDPVFYLAVVGLCVMFVVDI